MHGNIRIVLLTLLLTLGPIAAYAKDWSESHGGDAVAAEFKLVAKNIINLMKEQPSSLYTPELVERLEMSIERTQVMSEDRLFLHGIERDAITHTGKTPNVIQVSRSKWFQYDRFKKSREILALHEFLYTVRVDDTDYHYSIRIYDSLVVEKLGILSLNDYFEETLKGASECDVKILNAPLSVVLEYEQLYQVLEAAGSAGCVPIFKKVLFYGLIPKDSVAAIIFANYYNPYTTKELKQVYFDMLGYIGIRWGAEVRFDDIVCKEKFINMFPSQRLFSLGQTLLIRAVIGVSVYGDKDETHVVRDTQMIEFLMSTGYDPDLKDASGKSARDYAKMLNVDLNF